MSTQKVSMESLKNIGLDVVSEMFAQELQRVVRDLTDRPGDESTRSVTLSFKLKPQTNQNGVCEGALGQFSCSSSIPKQRTRTYSFGALANGQLTFNAASPDDIRQMTIDENKNPH